ncbi:hypothetical protein [Sulfurimonas sp. NWX79]|uniref:hypothetical protein n=1 Tax=Campylobacterales TaxID=213849 RepID=UPI003204AD04|nr:DNA polymerase [Sulfurimonas phage SNW-1]
MEIEELKTKYRINEIMDRNIDEFIGISRGLIADDDVNQSEAEFLQTWIEKHFNDEELDQYPLNTIYDRLKTMLSDNILDSQEAEELKELLKSFTGEKPISEQVDSMSSVLPLCDPLPDVCIEGSTFCLTGAFTIGSRAKCEKIIHSYYGSTVKKPTLGTDYLVIGILGNAEWIHSSYGRKIEKAVELRDVKNTGIKIITEEHFIKFL